MKKALLLLTLIVTGFFTVLYFETVLGFDSSRSIYNSSSFQGNRNVATNHTNSVVVTKAPEKTTKPAVTKAPAKTTTKKTTTPAPTKAPAKTTTKKTTTPAPTKAPAKTTTKKTTTPAPTKAPAKTTTTKKTTTPAPTKTPAKTTQPVMGNTGKYTNRHFEWISRDGKYTFYIDLKLSEDVYNYCRKLAREKDTSKWNCYYTLSQDQTAKYIADAFRQIQKQNGLSNNYIAYEAMYFVQSCFKYQTDIEGKGVTEYPKYPIETVIEGRGDCEDTSILMAAVLRELGFSSGIVLIPTHCATVVSGGDNISGTYYNKNGKKYFVVESTGKRKIGEIWGDLDWSTGRVVLF